MFFVTKAQIKKEIACICIFLCMIFEIKQKSRAS